MIRSLLFSVLTALVVSGSAMAGDQAWLHVRIDSDDPDGDRVRLNLPIEMIESMLPMIETDEFGHGRIQINDTDLNAAELRKMWNAVKSAEDGEFVSVENRRQSINVAKDDGILKVRIREHEGREEDRIDMQLPMEVVDAMLAGEGDELDLVAGLQALREHGHAILVTGTDEGSDIRIWVDDKPEM
jgi:hypothetical protein